MKFDGLKSLVYSRKFAITVAGFVATLLTAFAKGDPITVGSVAALFVGLVNAIAKEDASWKSEPVLVDAAGNAQ